jgi:hypothetical protein
MKKNNLIAIVCHVALCILGLILSVVVTLPFLQKQGLFFLGLLVTFLIICGLYVISGRFMDEQGSRAKNLLSVSSVSILLLLIAITSSFMSIHPSQDATWSLYIIANLSLFSVIIGEISDTTLMVCAYLFALIPSLCIWVGMNQKKPHARP